jgi:hypothetical protein
MTQVAFKNVMVKNSSKLRKHQVTNMRRLLTPNMINTKKKSLKHIKESCQNKK